MSINKRVETLIDKTSNSKSDFSKATGISTVILSHISSGRNKVSLTAVEQIIKAFPTINAEWILTGKGQMYRDGLDNDIAEELESALILLEDEHKRYAKSMESKISVLRRTIAALKG
jgi:hypothetical protein|tara:strand:+ start:79 stop:429 length:351 start_codon:yes stop_codon:yes gene_type:complete